MRTLRGSVSLALVSALPLLLSCSPQVIGEVVLAIRTDLAIPKDVERIVIDVSLAKTGESKFHKEYTALDHDHTFQLPATLGFYLPEDPNAAIRARVLALRAEDEPRLIRDVITTVPAERTVMLPIPIEFLCDQSAETVIDPTTKQPLRDNDGKLIFQSTCGDGLTCAAGKCVDAKVAGDSLVTFDRAQVFGGGTGPNTGACFDVVRCFDGAPTTEVTLGLDTCTIHAGKDVNVALLTQGAGMCGSSGCYVPLDAESDAGWQPGEDGELKLPLAVCDKLKAGTLGGVVTAPASTSLCARKQTSLPICGPFSSTGSYTPPDTSKPVVVASSQTNPLAIALAESPVESRVYWTTRGTFDDMDEPRSNGAVKRTPTAGGEATVIADAQGSPRALAVSAETGYLFWANATDGVIKISPLAEPQGTELYKNLERPEGLAFDGATLTWTELTANQVSQASIDVKKNPVTHSMPAHIGLLADQSSHAPHGVAAATWLACWTYEVKLDDTSGVVACNNGKSSIAVATGLSTPRAIAIASASTDDKAQTGSGTVYFANFDAITNKGGVYSVPSQGGPVTPVSPEDYPNGLAANNDAVYWTSRTQGTVMRSKGGMVTKIADHQHNPGAIAIGKDAIFWVNEGSIDKPDGAIVRLAK